MRKLDLSGHDQKQLVGWLATSHVRAVPTSHVSGLCLWCHGYVYVILVLEGLIALHKAHYSLATTIGGWKCPVHECDYLWSSTFKIVFEVKLYNSLLHWSFNVSSSDLSNQHSSRFFNRNPKRKALWFSMVDFPMLTGWEEASGIGREAQFGNDVARLYDSGVFFNPVDGGFLGGNTEIQVFSFSLFFMGRGGFHSLPCFFATKKANPRTLSDMARFYNFPKEEAPRARGGKTSELGGWEAGGFCMFLLLFLKGEEVIWTCFSSTYLVVSSYSKVGGCTSWSRNWNTESDQSFF